MRIGIAVLALAYVFSQFFRAFLAVLSEVLERDLGAAPEDLSVASGLWFLTFALMQLPVGWALDRIGPRLTASALFLVGGAGGSLLFAVAGAPWHVSAAMALLGVGCSPVLMASFYIFARLYQPRLFATLAATIVGTGSLGLLAGSAPLAWSIEAVGWRATMTGLAVITGVIAFALYAVVEDPPPPEQAGEGRLIDLLRIPALWVLFPLALVNYAPAAGLRGLWIGPYLTDTFGVDTVSLGNVTLIVSLAMIAGTYAYGPLDRVFGTRKWVAFIGNGLCVVALLALWAMPDRGLWTSAALICAVGATGATFALVMAHGRSFVPAHLAGRGVTLLNLFGIGGVGLSQIVTGRLYAGAEAAGATGAALYQPIFLYFAVILACGLAAYLFTRDRLD